MADGGPATHRESPVFSQSRDITLSQKMTQSRQTISTEESQQS
jgi:hypothetical protein